jgi:hypothetical protein
MFNVVCDTWRVTTCSRVLYDGFTIARQAKKFPAVTELKFYYDVHKSRPLDSNVEPNKSSPRYPNVPRENLFLLL